MIYLKKNVETNMLTQLASLGLIAKFIDDFWSGPNEGDACLFYLPRKLCVLRKKAITSSRRIINCGMVAGWMMDAYPG
jgi:hypothetical protein